MKSPDIVVIGGGAAGFFAAIHAAESGREVWLLEKSRNLLSKVLVSGGGRCNVTHAAPDPEILSQHYPRGARFLKRLFHSFHTQHTIDWFAQKGVQLKTEADGRMFPVTDDSNTIADCLLHEAKRLKVKIQTGFGVKNIIPEEAGGFCLQLSDDTQLRTAKVIIATGGGPKTESFHWLKELNLEIVPPLPSLFTFNLPGAAIRELYGLSVQHAVVALPELRCSPQEGPVLITHWGLSGPAILKLSAWAAKELAAAQYQTRIQINWLPEHTETSLRLHFQQQRQDHGKKLIRNSRFSAIPERLWYFLLQLSGITEQLTWAELNKVQATQLITQLLRYTESMQGKTTFKEEFVTCGGVSLQEVSNKMECKKWPGIYFAGEVLDIDGVTGGFNFQAAWTTGYLAGLTAGGLLK